MSKVKQKSSLLKRKYTGHSQKALRAAGYQPIENYGIIGDLHSVALVGINGSIDWCCLPHFNSPSVFAKILDTEKGGFFQIAPIHDARHKQMYQSSTCVLVSRFLNREGVGEVIDFMPIQAKQREEDRNHQIIRIVRVVRGEMPFRLQCFPSFNYGRDKHDINLQDHGAVFESENISFGLTSPVKLQRKKGGVVADFTLKQGEEYCFILRHWESGSTKKIIDPKFHYNACRESTADYWRKWATSCKYQGRWRENVKRSAMTLKLLTFEPTGAILAAPTTSLPENLGGRRNWDYRFTWIRDAAFTIYAFIRLGLTNEAERFMHWVFERCHEEAEDGSLQVMYGINGEHELTETVLENFEGYAGSKPVRLGNGAYNQLQLDIYGELMDAVYLANKYGKPVSYDLWRHLRRMLNFVCDNWKQKDEGIWEVRGGRHHFVYSKLMCWVALDRGLRLATKRSFPADRDKWLNTRDEIYEEIMQKGWNQEKKSFVQHYDTDAIDASVLMMPLTFFIGANDPRMESTINAIIKELTSDSLVYRYNVQQAAKDGFDEHEGTFSMCTFWLVEALTRAGRLNEAREMFEKMLTYANHLGLYAEEIGPSGEQLGNFPQAFTHLGLISAAYNLNRALG